MTRHANQDERFAGNPALREGVFVQRSPIEGLGLFASRGFAAGELIRRMNLVREITKEAPLRPDTGERVEHCAYSDGRVILVGHPDRHLNHSCDPNAYERHGQGTAQGNIEIVARRPIAADDEIRVDYLVNNSGGDSWACNCGAARCRGMTGTSFFDLPRGIRSEYRPLLADWFLAKHADRFRDRRESAATTDGSSRSDLHEAVAGVPATDVILTFFQT